VQGSCCPQEIKFNREDELGDLFNHMGRVLYLVVDFPLVQIN
jgi:hypothetical protein